jgi:cryptochrome 2
MWEDEAASKACSSKDRKEVIDENENLAIPKVFLKNKAPRGATGATSSNDQKVPILQNPKIKSDPPNSKRIKCMDEVQKKKENSRNHSEHTEVSCIDQEVLCSTAESASKRQCSSSCSFSVP